MGRTFRRCIAVVLASCVVAALTSCGADGDILPSDSPQPTHTVLDPTTVSASPLPTVEPTEPTEAPSPSPTSTYTPDGKPLVLLPQIGDIPGFDQDGDQWWCTDENGETDTEGSLEITVFNREFGIGGTTVKVTTTQNDTALTVTLSPVNKYYGGTVTHADETQLPFVLPEIAGEPGKYAPAFTLPYASFGEPKSIKLCTHEE